jgi:hypothetical protein
LFIVGRERAKLGYFWRHAYAFARSSPNSGCLVNPESGRPVMIDEQRLTAADFRQVKLSETDELDGRHPVDFLRIGLPKGAMISARRHSNFRLDCPGTWLRVISASCSGQ